MRIKYTNFIDKIDSRIPFEGEQLRPRVTLQQIDKYERMRDEGNRLLEIGDAKLRAFKWESITSDSIVPTKEQAVQLLLTISENIQ